MTHFSGKELQCPCCGENKTTIGLLEILEQMREVISAVNGKDTPLILNSVYRCEKHNDELKNSSRTLRPHCQGRAADIRIFDSIHRHQVLHFAVTCGRIKFIEIGENYIHIDTIRREAGKMAILHPDLIKNSRDSLLFDYEKTNT